MRDSIINLIRNELSAYDDKITELTDEINELNRRTNNIIRAGVCSEINNNNQMIKVRHGDNETPFIKWFSCSAGEVLDYRCPSVGEQCVILNYDGGDNSSQTFALFGIFSNQFPSPSADKNEILRVYPDGTRVSYHTKTHKMNITAVGDVDVNVKGIVKVDGEKIHLNGGCGVVTGNHICMVTGQPHGDYSATVTAGE